MAAWFPLKVIRRFIDAQEVPMEVEYDTMFPDADISSYDQAPWSTGY